MFKIHILHSQSPFYTKMLGMVKHRIQEKWPDVKIESEVLNEFSGAFELTAIQRDKKYLIHSKLNSGEAITTETIGYLIKKIEKKTGQK